MNPSREYLTSQQGRLIMAHPKFLTSPRGR